MPPPIPELPVVTRILGSCEGLGEPPSATDPVVLSAEERVGAHFSAVTVGGRRLRVSLPRGTELMDGDILLFDGETAIVVRAAEEDLLLVVPGEDPVGWWAACYQLGNLHRPARFLAEGVLTPSDPMAEEILRGLGIAFSRVRRPFTGRRVGAVASHHGDHRHSHGPTHRHGDHHDHAHGHDHSGHRHSWHGHDH